MTILVRNFFPNFAGSPFWAKCRNWVSDSVEWVRFPN